MGDNHGVSAYPLPPMQYVALYSDDNTGRKRDLPPPPPIQDSYMMFDAPFSADDTILRPLDSQPGLRRLYPQNCDHKRELKKLNHSILVNFLDLIDIMIKAPDSPKRQEKLDDLQLLFINMHHLINEFRPHQARETLRVMMERQMKQRLEIAEKFEKHLDKVKELLQTCIGSLPEDGYQDSKVLVKSELLTQDALTAVKTEPETSACDTLDKMMCDIIDGMT